MSSIKSVLIRVAPAPEAYSGHPQHRFPPLDLKYIQTALDGAPLIDGWLADESPEALATRALETNPTVAIIKAASSCIERAVKVGRVLKDAGVLTIAVGQQVCHVTVREHPGWFEAFDIPVQGDPEEAIPGLIDRMTKGEPREGLIAEYRDRAHLPFHVEAPDNLPVPKFAANELTAYPFPFALRTGTPTRWGYVLGAWGCPYQCRHCSQIVRKSTGSVLRKRSPAAVIDEVEGLLAAGAQAISFEDDTLLGDREGCLAICAEIIKRGLKFSWIANARPTELDAEVVDKLSQAGATLLKVGVESGSGRVIEALGKAASGADWIDASRNAFALLHRKRIGSVALFMIGSPGETMDEVKASVELAKALEPDYVQVQIFSLYPDIDLYAELSTNASGTPNAEPFHYSTPGNSPSEIPAEKLLPVQSAFYKRFYLRFGFFFSHLARFWKSYLLNPRSLFSGLATALWLTRSRGHGK
jgi:radical SAM superfamily enzyme YgiQ (UPF0313 family)